MPLRILVVEEYPDAGESCALLLRLLGHDVLLAGTCAEALRVAVGFGPDLVLLDIGLPDGDGHDLANQLVAALPRRPLLVAVTGYPHLEGRSERAGFDGHLVKPVAPEALAAILNGVRSNRGYAQQSEPPAIRRAGRWASIVVDAALPTNPIH